MSLWFPKLETTTTAAPATTSTQRNFDEGTVDFNDFITESPDSSVEDEENSDENRLEKFDAIFKRRQF